MVSLLLLLLLVGDDLHLLLHLVHSGGHLLDAHLVRVWPGKVALSSTLGSHQDDFPSSLLRALGWAPASLHLLQLHGVGLHGGHLLGGVPLVLVLLGCS